MQLIKKLLLIPLSQLSDKFVENADEFMGQTLDVKVTRVDQKRGRAVFSHKIVLNEEKQKKIAAIWEGLHVDDIVEGTVMRFTDYGAFVESWQDRRTVTYLRDFMG